MEGFKMKKTDGHLNIEVNVSCPYCEEYFDLMNSEDFESLNEEGYINSRVLNNSRFGCNDFNETIECTNCKKEFIVTEVWW
jgi:hypothetical protein